LPRITVDGIDYAPIADSSPSIGVAITSRNRPDILADTLQAFRTHSPDIPVVVVDDGSDTPISADVPIIRHQTARGIPAAKNRCIAELMKLGVQHLFLFDDDTKPTAPHWWRQYVESPEPHLQFSWTHFANGKPVDRMTILHTNTRTTAYGWSMGCMLYTHRDVINRVGGMRECFAPAMHEHIEWSQRIHNAGLTSWPFQDVPGAQIHAADHHQAVQSSIMLRDRRKQLERNDQLLTSLTGSTDYVPYGTENVVLSCLFTGQPDPQRGNRMKPTQADYLLSTCQATVFCDFDTPDTRFTKVHATENPYIQRWITYRQHLIDHPEIRYVWCVDATDVQQLQNPFPMMKPGVLYTGWENQIVGCEWMRQHTASLPWIDANPDRTLLNAGVVGADRQTMLTFIGRLLGYWSENKADKPGDMGYFNRAAYTLPVQTGPRITTVFKANQPTEWSLWRHK